MLFDKSIKLFDVFDKEMATAKKTFDAKNDKFTKEKAQVRKDEVFGTPLKYRSIPYPQVFGTDLDLSLGN